MAITNLALAVRRPARADERFPFETAACWRRRGDDTWRIGLVVNISASGLRLDLAERNTLHSGEPVELRLPRIGGATAHVARVDDDTLGLSFDAMDDEMCDRLVQVLASGGRGRRIPV